MIQVTQSPLLQALGYAIINSLWQFALLWLVYILVNSFLKFTSHQRYAGALTLQLLGFLWFVVTAIFYYGECIRNADAIFSMEQGYSSLAASGSSLSFKEMFFSVVLRAELLLPYLSLAYLILITALTIKVVKSYRNTQTLRYHGLTKIDVKWRLFVNQISGQLGIKRNVRLYISSLIESPVTIGFLKPLILLPAAVVNNLSTDQIEAILIHELAHIKRNDYVINILVSIVEVTLFFNPFMQLISKQMRRERENSCDDWVLQYEYSACNYAKALLKIATYKTSNTANFAVNAVDNRRALLIRVKRMIEKKDLYNTYRQQLVSLIFITAAISSLAWFTPKKYPHATKSKTVTTSQLNAEPLVAKVDNPLFNPIFFLAEDDQNEINTALVKAEKEINKSAEPVSISPAIKDVEMEIADQFTTPAKPARSVEPLKEVHAVNIVLDSALFQNYATKALIVSEIKKLKKEFESLNSSSLFQNVNWKQFWDNTKVQKQLESAFEQLKALEKQQKNKSLIINAVNKSVSDADGAHQTSQAQLKMLASKQLALIVKDRINDIKHQHSSNTNISTDLNFNFELPDLSQLNIKENSPWSYVYDDKIRIAYKQATTTRVKVSTATTSSCKESKEKKKEKMVEVAPSPEARAEKILRSTAPRTIKIVRI